MLSITSPSSSEFALNARDSLWNALILVLFGGCRG